MQRARGRPRHTVAAACLLAWALQEGVRRLRRRWFTWRYTLRLGAAADHADAGAAAACGEAFLLCACAEPHERFDAELAPVRGRADTTVLASVTLRLAPGTQLHAAESAARTLRGALDAAALGASSPGSLWAPAAASLWLRAHARVRRGADGAPHAVCVTLEGHGTRLAELLDELSATLRLRADGAPFLRATLALDHPLSEAVGHATPPSGTLHVCFSARLRTALRLCQRLPPWLASAAWLGIVGRLPTRGALNGALLAATRLFMAT